MLVLLLSGDVESNPGPDDQVLNSLISGQKEILEKIGVVSINLDDYIARTDSRLNSFESEVKRLSSYSVQFDHCEKVVKPMAQDFAALRSKIDDLDNRSRRNKLVIYGLKETDEETQASLRKQVIDGGFSSKMGVDAACVERIHRVGTIKQTGKRQVILRFYDYNVKNELFKHAHKLKDTGLSLNNDYSHEARLKRKNLWEYAKAKREQGGHSVKLIHDRLFIDGATFTWNSEAHEIVRYRRK